MALLLFLVGLELSVDCIREVGRTAAVVGSAQMAATFLLGGGLALGLGFSPVESLFVGLAVTFSSTVVVVKLLEEAGNIATRYGRLSVGVLLVQDVGVALALTVVAGMGAGGESASPGRQLGISLLGLAAGVALSAPHPVPGGLLEDGLVLGVSVLLFVAGLELEPGRIGDRGRAAVLVGLVQALALAGLGFGVCLPLGFSPVEAGYLALAITAISTLVGVRILERRREVFEPCGRVMWGSCSCRTSWCSCGTSWCSWLSLWSPDWGRPAARWPRRSAPWSCSAGRAPGSGRGERRYWPAPTTRC